MIIFKINKTAVLPHLQKCKQKKRKSSEVKEVEALYLGRRGERRFASLWEATGLEDSDLPVRCLGLYMPCMWFDI